MLLLLNIAILLLFVGCVVGLIIFLLKYLKRNSK